MTDHSNVGALLAHVNHDTGMTGPGIEVRSSSAPLQVDTHPDSDLQLSGTVLPYWEDVKRITSLAHARCPGIHFASWDALIGQDGAVLIEGNVGNPMSVYQIMLGPFSENGILSALGDELDCDLPDGSLAWRVRNSRTTREIRKLRQRHA
jgi:hypothetical protein